MFRKIYFLLPVYNESKSIHDLLLNIDAFSQTISPSVESIVIDDCSKDDSKKWIQKAKNNLKNITLTEIFHTENQGLRGALNSGFAHLSNQVSHDTAVITMDGDNTHNPYLVREMIERLEQGADMAIASRYCPQSRISGLPKHRIFLSQGARLLYKIFWRIPGVKDYTCLFRAHSGELLKKFYKCTPAPYLEEKSFACTTELLAKLNKAAPTIVEVPMILKYGNKFSASNVQLGRTILSSLQILTRKA
ncbi:MAG: glycosyltransferase family 2 protein [Alphaproteobacteria bacterium]|jgi:dolichol-phosphate mannosyltransferase|nr:glycosyltransferase family 2 protein [Alphaproteobacteria bacterium]MBT5390575.1 glycosyltransferase family 2 protein [Alphaproteobacteria bacterium]MBT5540934.1 glycosyltransferase family 2 protein [Alphaproteobacteria bacterium]MBT5654368.1 glycosyltransferase family 2 protein [Alphaproteobacteria bacterium]